MTNGIHKIKEIFNSRNDIPIRHRVWFDICLSLYKIFLLIIYVYRFFLQEIQAGEALISSGDIEQGVTHLANAVVVCGQPTQLLQVSL